MESAALAAEQACGSNLQRPEDVTLREDATEKRRVADSYLAAIRNDIRIAPAPLRASVQRPQDNGPSPAAPKGTGRP